MKTIGGSLYRLFLIASACNLVQPMRVPERFSGGMGAEDSYVRPNFGVVWVVGDETRC